MNPHPRPRINPLQLLHRPQYPLPNREAVQVALIEHGVGVHGSMDRRVLVEYLHEELGGAVDVEIEDHGRSLQSCHLVRLMPKVTPTKLKCLRMMGSLNPTALHVAA